MIDRGGLLDRLLSQWHATCLLALLCPALGFAQSYGTDSRWDGLTTPFFHHLSVPKDLPSAGIAIAQDRQDFIWIGTQDGLVRWDGYRPKLFRHDDNDRFSLPNNLVNGLIVDEDGTLFVATSNGIVSRFDPATEHFLPLPATSTGTAIYASFIEDKEGGLWLGNANGLSHLVRNGSQWETVQLPDHMRVWSLLRGRDGTIWAGTDRGLVYRPVGASTFVEVKKRRLGLSASARQHPLAGGNRGGRNLVWNQ
jgi:ligand-binding sensor domain-containing protein